MSSQTKFILILVGVLVMAGLMGAGGWVLFRNIQSVTQNQNSPSVLTNGIPPVISVNGVVNLNVSGVLNRNTSVIVDDEANGGSSEEELRTLSRSFAERYGSYSSNNSYQNLRDLKSFMTDRLWNASEQMMKSAASSEEYFGVTSRALQVEVLALESARATVQVTLQRRESKGQANPSVYYQPLTLKLVTASNAWLVDELAWGQVF